MNICARLEEGITTRSAEECQAIAAEFALALPPDAVLALHGDLGVGKTTFVRGLARALGVTANLTSPTFTVFNLYKGRDGMTLAHMDAYRLEGPEAMASLMLEDFLVSPFCLAIEWPERVAAWLPAHTWHLHLGIHADQTHHLRLDRRSAQ